MKNMDIWNKVCQPPSSALKTIKGGRLSGMTDINPQWRFKAMTEMFGPCGIGWRWTLSEIRRMDGADGESMLFATVWLYVKHEDQWSEGIPGVGGTKLVAKERDGLHNNDEAIKMATTDALSVAMKSLGVGADIYMGLWDGSKYKGSEANASQGEANTDITESPMAQAAHHLKSIGITGKDARKVWDEQLKVHKTPEKARTAIVEGDAALAKGALKKASQKLLVEEGGK